MINAVRRATAGKTTSAGLRVEGHPTDGVVMGAELSGRFYNIALAVIAVGYVLLLWSLMHAHPPQKAAGPPPGAFTQPVQPEPHASGLALNLALQAAASKGLTRGPSGVNSSCTASGPGELCTVTGFIGVNGVGNCSLYVFVPGTGGSAYVRNTQCR